MSYVLGAEGYGWVDDSAGIPTKPENGGVFYSEIPGSSSAASGLPAVQAEADGLAQVRRMIEVASKKLGVDSATALSYLSALGTPGYQNQFGIVGDMHSPGYWDQPGIANLAYVAQNYHPDDAGWFSGMMSTIGSGVKDLGTNFVLPAMAMYAGVSGLGGAFGAAEGEAGLASAAEGAGGLDWSSIQSIPGSGSAGYAGSGVAMDFTSLIGADGDVTAAIDAISNSGLSMDQKIQAMQAVNNAASGGTWADYLANPEMYSSGAAGGSNWLSKVTDYVTNNPGTTAQTALKALGLTTSNGGVDWGKLLGAGLSSGLGAYASNKQTNALADLSNKYMEMGAPYRAKLASLYADPSSFLKDPSVTASVDQGTNALMRSLSTQGNPFGSGNALQQGQDYATKGLYSQLGAEKDRLAGFGGLTAYNAAAPQAATNSIASSGNVYNAIGSGLGNIFNPPQTAAQQLTALQKALNGTGA